MMLGSKVSSAIYWNFWNNEWPTFTDHVNPFIVDDKGLWNELVYIISCYWFHYGLELGELFLDLWEDGDLERERDAETDLDLDREIDLEIDLDRCSWA